MTQATTSTASGALVTATGGVPGRAGRRLARRRPSGAAPPLPRHLRITGVGWLVAALVGIVVAVVVFGNGVSGAAIPVTVVDNTVVRWMSEIDGPASRGLPGV